MKAAKDKGEEFCDPGRKDNTLGRKQSRLELWEEHLKRPNHSFGRSSEVPRKSLSGLTSCSKFLRKVTRIAMACSWGSGILQKMWERPFWEGVWPHLDPWDSVRLRTASTQWNVPGKGRTASFFFFIKKKEQVVASNEVLPTPFASAETLSTFLAAEGEDGSSGSRSHDQGDTWRCGSSTRTESEGTSSSEQCEHNMESPCSECYGARPVR